MTCKYPFGARLNEKGMKIYGDSFPDGLIPVLSPFPITGLIEGLGETKIYEINIPLLVWRDQEGYHKSLKILSDRFKVPVEVLDSECRKNGMPLRAELVSGVRIDPRFVIP